MMHVSVVPSIRLPSYRWRLTCTPTDPNETKPETPTTGSFTATFTRDLKIRVESDVLGSDIPVQLIRWGGTLPSRRRFVQGLSFATFVALGGNFGGVTSLLLGLDGGRVASVTKLDVLVPVTSYKRCWNPDLGFEFVYPAEWLADQTLMRRAAERIEQENPLDLPSLRATRRSFSSDPVVAFGPPGGRSVTSNSNSRGWNDRGEENVSLIVTESAPGFELRSLGTVEEAAKVLLETRIAPAGSDIIADLIRTNERLDSHGNLYYSMEYRVRSPRWYRHNIAVFAARQQKLYTLNAQCPESEWEQDGTTFQTMAESLRLG